MNDKTGQIPRILVVSNDFAARHALVDYLNEHFFHAAFASGLHEMARHLEENGPNLVVLDLAHDPEEGLDFLGEIRSRSNVPVIITDGCGCDAVDRVVALALGADDYLATPMSPNNLLERIHAILQRQNDSSTMTQAAEQGGCRFGGWQLCRGTRSLIDPQGTSVTLTKWEYALLDALLQAPQRPLTREELLRAARTHDDVFDGSIEVQILRLRRKLEADPSVPHVIRTTRGVGYVFALPVEAF